MDAETRGAGEFSETSPGFHRRRRPAEKMSIEVVQPNVDDAERVLAYYTDLLADRIPFILDNPVPTLEQEVEFIRRHDGEQAALFMAVAGGGVVGLAGYTLAAHHQRRHTCSFGISVAKAWRGRGIGASLIRAGEDWCASRSVRRLSCEMIEGNPAAAFYERLGFEIEGRKRQAIQVGESFKDLIIMAKLLA